jgi:hypothetical protein
MNLNEQLQRIFNAGFLGIAITKSYDGNGVVGQLLYSDGHSDIEAWVPGQALEAESLLHALVTKAESMHKNRTGITKMRQEVMEALAKMAPEDRLELEKIVRNKL